MATGADLLHLAAAHLGEPYVLGAQVPKNNPNWDGPWDCAEFTAWCVFQAGGRLYGCSNNQGNPARVESFSGWWGRDARGIGREISVAEAARIPGAVVYRAPRTGAIGHVVFSDGRGGTFEAKSRSTGVVRSTLDGRRWDMGILVPWIDYAAGPPVPVRRGGPIYRLTTPLMRGPTVRAIQMALLRRGINPGDTDGLFGVLTAAAVSSFQAAAGLVQDGEVGPETARALGIPFP
ncbi:MAG TPA: peptidoglycan-binding domain-containing protein [Longimicrobium sp.]|jgi:hypothetical protein|uniref:peptidoglycan-binding domain-containing protein n=1 Tax=Longimicrobium sp. TaxID=2029185 RepID=UPI002ED998BF